MYLKFKQLKIRAESEVSYENTLKIVVKANLILQLKYDMSVLMCTFLDFMELYRQCNLLIEERTGDNLIRNNILKLKKTGKIVTHQIN